MSASTWKCLLRNCRFFRCISHECALIRFVVRYLSRWHELLSWTKCVLLYVLVAALCGWVKMLCYLEYSQNSTWLVTSRHDTTRSTCRAHAFWLCRACRTAWLDTLDTTSSTGSTRSSRRARHAFWLCRICRTALLDTLVSTRSTRQTWRVVSRRDVTWRDEPSGMWACTHLSIVFGADQLQRIGRIGNVTICIWHYNAA